MAKKNIGATISLKDGGFNSGIKSAITSLGSLKKGSEGATSSMKKFGSQSSSAGTSLASLAKKALGVVAAYASFKTVVNWSKQCIDAANVQANAEKRLETLMMNVKGTTLQNVDAMKKYASELQGVTTVGDEATIQGASQLATFQLQSDTIKTLLPSLQDLAVSQYGVAVSGDQMQSMANLMGKVMTGNVGALTRYGVTLSDAQAKILKTGTESEKAAMLVEVLGQNFGGLSEAMANTPEGKIQQLKNAWGDMQEVIGTKLYPIVTQVLTYITGKLPGIQSAFTTVVNAVMPGIQGIATFATTMIDTIWNGVQSYILPAFGSFKDALSPVFDGLTNMGNSFSWTDILTGALQVVGAALEGVAAATGFVIDNWNIIGPIVYGVAGAMAAYNVAVGITNGLQAICAATTGASAATMGAMSFSELAAATATGVLTAAQTALNTAFLASPIGWIAVGVAALIAVFVALWKNCEGFRNFFIGMWEKIKVAFSTVVNALKSALGPLKEAMTGAFKEAWAVIKQVWDFVAPYFNALWNTVKQYFNVVKVYISGAINTAWTIIKAVWDTVVGYFTAIWNTIKGIFSVVKNVLSGNWQGAWDAIKGIVAGWGAYFQGIWNSIKSVFSAVGSWFSSTFSAAWTAIKNIFATWGSFFSGLWNGIVNVFSVVGSWFGSIFSSAWQAVVNAFSGVVGFFQGIWDTIKNMFTSIGTSIADGISGAFKAVVNSVISFAGNLINGFINSINWAIGVINKIPGVNITKLQTVNLPMLATGGNITRAGDVIVGEKGPEMLHLPRGAQVEPLDRNKNKGGNVFNIHIDARDKTPEEIVNELMPKLKLALDII